MGSILDAMTENHRLCDELFAAVEKAVADGAWARAVEQFALFQQAMQQHFDVEETILFPAFEERTGMRMGPTQVMRGEHAQISGLISAAEVALADHDADEYSGNAETLLIMTQQHNMKEEGILYPMCDQHLAPQLDRLLAQLQGGMTTRKS